MLDDWVASGQGVEIVDLKRLAIREAAGQGSMTGQGTPDDRIEALETLLVQTGEAHGMFEETDLKGNYDREWAAWYAAYAVERGIGALVGNAVTADRLAEFLASSNVEFERIEPKAREPWAVYTARRIAAEL